jgi:hypothetical protein
MNGFQNGSATGDSLTGADGPTPRAVNLPL